MAKKNSNLVKTIHQQVQEAEQKPSAKNINKTTPMHMTIKLFQTNDKKKKSQKQKEKKDIKYKE